MKKLLAVVLLSWLVVPVPTYAEVVTTQPTPVTEASSPITSLSPDVFVTLTRTGLSNNNLPFNAQSATPDEFTSINAQTSGDSVSRMTSVSVSPQGQIGTTRLAGIRGATSNQTLVLIDGRPMGGVGLSGSQDLSEIPNDQIDHVEVVRGGVSALYGPNAIGGVINIITKRGAHAGKTVADVGVQARPYDTQAYHANFGSKVGPLDYFVFGDKQMQSGFRDNSDSRTHNIGGNVGLAMAAAGKLTFDLSSYHANSGVSGQLFPDIPPNQFNNTIEKVAGTPDAHQITDSGYLRTAYLLPLPMNSLGTFRLFDSQRRVQFQIPSFFVSSDRHESTKGGDVQLDLPLGLSAGGTFTHDRLDSTDFITPANNYIAWVEDWGLFAQEDFRWKMLSVIPSVRYDKHSTAGDATNPRVQLMADATDWLRFSGSAGKSFRAPTIDDLYTPFTDFGGGFSYVGNPTLRPEKAWTYDAGFQVGHDSCTFKAGYFRANITDLIQTTPDLASTSINVGSARRQGGEFEVAHVLNAYFKQSVNYTYLENRGKPQGYTDFVTLRLSPKHTVNYLATVLPFKGFKLDNTLRYVSSRYEGNDQTNTKIGDALLWGLRLGYQIRQLELFVGADDVANKRYEERAGYPLPGRMVYGGANWKL